MLTRIRRHIHIQHLGSNHSILGNQVRRRGSRHCILRGSEKPKGWHRSHRIRCKRDSKVDRRTGLQLGNLELHLEVRFQRFLRFLGVLSLLLVDLGRLRHLRHHRLDQGVRALSYLRSFRQSCLEVGLMELLQGYWSFRVHRGMQKKDQRGALGDFHRYRMLRR